MIPTNLTVSMEQGELPGLWHWSLMLETGRYIQTDHGSKFGHKRAEAAMTKALEKMRLFAEGIEE